MNYHGVLAERNILDFKDPAAAIQEELLKQELIKQKMNLYYDDYYIHNKRKKTTKSKRALSK